MSRAAVHRLREIAAARRLLDTEEETLLAALADLDGALDDERAKFNLGRQGDGLQSLPFSDLSEDILTSDHVTVAKLAEKLRVSEKTARGIGNAAGARVQIGGRVLFDLAIVRKHLATVNYRKLPSSAVSDGEQISDDAT